MIHNVIGLALRVTGTKMHGENFTEGSMPTGWIGASIAFQISRMKFL